MRRRNGWVVTAAAGVLSAALLSTVTGRAQEAVPGGGPAQTRAEAIRDALAGIEQELKDHGGTWEKWGESIKPYRDDIHNVLKDWQKYKWPWPAKDSYVFQGAAVQLHMLDTLDGQAEGERAFESILHFDRQLKALNVDLIVAIIPSKMSVYCDYMYAAVEGEPQRPARAPADRQVSVAVKQLMYRLLQNDVEVVDLHKAFAEFRQKNGEGMPLFYVRDGHYLNRGARLSAEKIAERLKRYDFVQQALAAGNACVAEKGARTDGDKADNDLLIIKKKSGEPQRDDPASKIHLLGDSHLYYNQQNRALTSAQIAYLIGMPIAMTWKEGLAGTIPVEVAKDSNLTKRRVVIVHYTERMLAPRPGRSKWSVADLPGAQAAPAASATPTPPAASAAGLIKDLPATGVIVEACPPPDVKADYPHYLRKFYVKQLADGSGKAVGTGDGVVWVLAMHNRKILRVASAAVGEKLSVRLTSWAHVPSKYGKIQTGTLPTVMLEIEKPFFWGEVAGQPQLTAEELSRVGESDAPEARAEGSAPAAAAAGSAEAPGDGDWRLELDRAANGTPLVAHMAFSSGKPAAAFGFSPKYNKGIHEADPSGLKFAEGRLAGTLAVTVKSDAWVPKDGKPVSCAYELDAVVKDGKVTGTYKGKFGGADTVGSVGGVVEARRGAIKTGRVELALQNAIEAQAAHARAVNLSFAVTDGKAGDGTIQGFHAKAISGKVTSLDLQVGAETLTGQVKISVASGVTVVGDGAYTFDLSGKVIGGTVAGTFKGRAGDKELAGGAFSGAIKALTRQEGR